MGEIINERFLPSARGVAFFHGESWYKCPYKCGFSFEVYDAEFERNGIVKVGKNAFRCPQCKKVFKIV